MSSKAQFCAQYFLGMKKAGFKIIDQPQYYYLKSQGVTFAPHATRTEYDGDVYEIVDRKTGEPLFCAIPEEA